MKKLIGLSGGFTLMELLVVMGVLGTLAAGVIVVMDPVAQMGKARDAQRKSDLAQIQRALEIYYDDYQEYPATADLNDLQPPAANYIQKVPNDPVSSKYQYRYVADPDQQIYRLHAHLESKQDPQACNQLNPLDNCPNAPTANPRCGVGSSPANCNYGVASPNASP